MRVGDVVGVFRIVIADTVKKIPTGGSKAEVKAVLRDIE